MNFCHTDPNLEKHIFGEEKIMSIKLAVPETNITHLKPRISVIGVGGGGGNAVNNMIAQNLEGVDFIVANTDSQALTNSSASRKIQLGLQTTQGLGAGARPEIGRQAAEEAKEEIEKELEGSNMVFITAGMGGGTGSGAAPVVAKLAKQKGILTIGVVTKPFQFEGRKRMETAEAAVEEFTKSVDSIIIIPNQNLFRIADKKTTLADAFIMADNVLYSGVRSITDLITIPGLINLDFADITSIMQDKGKAIMGTGEAEGEDRAIKAAEQALSNPLLDDCNIHGAKGVLINITGGSDITLFEIDEAASRIKEEVDESAEIIFGSSYDESLTGKIRVSIVATGVDEKAQALPKQPQAAKIASYIEQSYQIGTIEKPIVPTAEIDSNLEKFSATKPVVEVEEQEEIKVEIPAPLNIVETEEEPAAPIFTSTPAPAPQAQPESQVQTAAAPTAPQTIITDPEFSSVETSAVINEMPKASSLFKAIINNKPEDASASAQLESALSSNENTFTSRSSLRAVEPEPELFPKQNPSVFAAKPAAEEPEKLIVEDEDEEYTPTLIERVTGFSIAKRNRKKKEAMERYEQMAPSFDSAENDDSKLNLEIPSFLRRR